MMNLYQKTRNSVLKMANSALKMANSAVGPHRNRGGGLENLGPAFPPRFFCARES